MVKTTFKQAKASGVPLLFYETADPAQTVRSCRSQLNGRDSWLPLIQWDAIRGLRGLNKPGQEAIAAMCNGIEPRQITNPAEALGILGDNAKELRVENPDKPKKYAGGVAFMLHLNRFLDNPSIMQGVWNLRDTLEPLGVMLVALGPQFTLPAELRNDVVVLQEPLPDREELTKIVDSVCADAGIDASKLDGKEKIVSSLTGLSAFAARQIAFLSRDNGTLDRETLWQRKARMIEGCKGLSIYKGKEKFADIGGLEAGKKELSEILSGPLKITCLVLVDEIDKGVAAAATDSSGTTQDQCKVMLSYMQDYSQTGMLWLGPPGTGKTLLAKAAANEFGIPLIMVDLGEAKSRFVGDSEAAMREMIRVIQAVSDGRALWIGTCNLADRLTPELRRRFSFSLMFFDLPSKEERAGAWQVHLRKYSVTGDPESVNDAGWTGAEIEQCCKKAYATGQPIAVAAKRIVPVSRSAGDLVETMRKAASGKYVSASYPGLYQYEIERGPTGRQTE